MKNLVTKLKKIISNPLSLFLIIIIISFATLCLNGFTVKDYYIDREKAQTIIDANWNGEYTKNIEEQLDTVTNKKFYPVNRSYNALVFSLLSILLLFAFKIKKYRDLSQLSVITNKGIIFTWINLSYILFSYLILSTIEADLTIQVLPAVADSLSIPIFSTLIGFIILAIPYYIITNLVFYITYRKTVNNCSVNLGNALFVYKPLFTWKYGFITIFHLLMLAINLLLLGDLFGKFYLILPIRLLFSFVWIYISLSAISVLVYKVEQSTIQDASIKN